MQEASSPTLGAPVQEGLITKDALGEGGASVQDPQSAPLALLSKENVLTTTRAKPTASSL